MKTTASNKKLRELLTKITNGSLMPRPEFQRRLVWSNKHKKAFIETVLDSYPFPEIYIAAGTVDTETGEGTEMLVDGQQRITTLLQYFKAAPELKLGSITPYSELSQEDKIRFLEYDVVVRDLGSMSIENILEIFKRINSTNYALNTMEIHNARFDGVFKMFGDELAENDFFEKRRVFTSGDIKRMRDTLFALTLVSTLMSTYFNREDEVEIYLEKYNETFDEIAALREQLSIIFKFIDDCELSSNSRAWNKADLFTLIVELHRAMFKKKLSLDLLATKKRLNDFYNEVEEDKDSSGGSDEVIQYYQTTARSSTDRGRRIKRGEIIYTLLTSK